MKISDFNIIFHFSNSSACLDNNFALGLLTQPSIHTPKKVTFQRKPPTNPPIFASFLVAGLEMGRPRNSAILFM